MRWSTSSRPAVATVAAEQREDRASRRCAALQQQAPTGPRRLLVVGDGPIESRQGTASPRALSARLSTAMPIIWSFVSVRSSVLETQYTACGVRQATDPQAVAVAEEHEVPAVDAPAPVGWVVEDRRRLPVVPSMP